MNERNLLMDNCNILIIDDSVEIIELIEIYLLNEGYRVYKALNGPDGLRILETQKIHLVVLDIMLPGIDEMVHANI